MMETAWLKNSKTTRYGSGSRAAAGDLKRKAILAVSFGTSYRKTRDAAIGAIDKDRGKGHKPQLQFKIGWIKNRQRIRPFGHAL